MKLTALLANAVTTKKMSYERMRQLILSVHAGSKLILVYCVVNYSAAIEIICLSLVEIT